MRKGKALTIAFGNWEDFKTKARSALKTGKPAIAAKGTLTFASVADYQSFMTEQKIAILAAIARKRLPSIYQLAQTVERDFANVQRDCVALEAMGFISLEASGDAKKSKAPKLAFPYSRIVVKTPGVSYSHDLLEAA